ncbi:MAG: YdbH domain-containing protein, partial [Pseudomonadales bacterium]
PVARARIETLELEISRLGFQAIGQISTAEDLLEISLKGVQPAPAVGFQLNARLSADGLINAEISEVNSDGPSYLRLDSAIAQGRLDIDVQYRLEGYAFAFVSELAEMPAGSGRVSGQISSSLPWPLEPVPDWQSVSAAGPFELGWTSADGNLALRALKGNAQLTSGMLRAEVGGHADFTSGDLKGQLTLPANQVVRLDLQGLQTGAGIEVELSGDDLQAQFLLRSLNIAYQPELVIELTTQLQATAQDAGIEGELSGTLRAAPAVSGDYLGEIGFVGNVDSRAVALPVDLAGGFAVSDSKFTAAIDASSGMLGPVPVVVAYEIGKGAGTLSVHGGFAFDEPLFSSTLAPWEEPYDLDSGRLSLNLEMRWQSPGDLHADVELMLDESEGRYGDYSLEGISARVKVSSTQAEWTIEPSTISVSRVDFGFPLTDITASLSGSLSSVRIHDVSARLLGGTGRMSPFEYDFELAEAATEVLLIDLDFAEILALEGEDITGNGRLDGTLPVSFNADGITVSGGRIFAREPGGTVFLAENLASAITKPGLDFALRALGNFHYSKLEADVNYRANGDLVLGVHLKGSNPDVESGRLIDYNLNISENIPVLLESLRMEDSYTERIEKKALQ